MFLWILLLSVVAFSQAFVLQNEGVQSRKMDSVPVAEGNFYILRRGGPTPRNLYKYATLWPGGVVPYITTNLSKFLQDDVKKVAEDLKAHTCIQLRPKLESDTDFLEFRYRNEGEKSYACGWAVAGVGMSDRGTPNAVVIECEVKGVLGHEVMHKLGFNHEQLRADRNRYMDVFFQNLPYSYDESYDGMEGTSSDLSLPYDYSSIMHYQSFHTLGGEDHPYELNMLPKANPCIKTGPYKFSKLDYQKINKAYNCPNRQPTFPFIIDPSNPTNRISVSESIQSDWEYDLELQWSNGTTLLQCFMENEKEAKPKAIGCLSGTKTVHKNGELFKIGEYSVRCDISEDGKDAKITILDGCDNFKWTEWIVGRYSYNYECISSEKKIVKKIVGCVTPEVFRSWKNNITRIVRDGEEIEARFDTGPIYCKIFDNGLRAVNWHPRFPQLYLLPA